MRNSYKGNLKTLFEIVCLLLLLPRDTPDSEVISFINFNNICSYFLRSQAGLTLVATMDCVGKTCKCTIHNSNYGILSKDRVPSGLKWIRCLSGASPSILSHRSSSSSCLCVYLLSRKRLTP